MKVTSHWRLTIRLDSLLGCADAIPSTPGWKIRLRPSRPSKSSRNEAGEVVWNLHSHRSLRVAGLGGMTAHIASAIVIFGHAARCSPSDA